MKFLFLSFFLLGTAFANECDTMKVLGNYLDEFYPEREKVEILDYYWDLKGPHNMTYKIYVEENGEASLETIRIVKASGSDETKWDVAVLNPNSNQVLQEGVISCVRSPLDR